MGMIVKNSCAKCGKDIGTIQYSNYYECNEDWGEYTCVDCYKKGQKTCLKCGKELSYHNGKDTEKAQRKGGYIF